MRKHTLGFALLAVACRLRRSGHIHRRALSYLAMARAVRKQAPKHGEVQGERGDKRVARRSEAGIRSPVPFSI
jgi:hypothetical protein